MEQEKLNEQELPTEGALTNGDNLVDNAQKAESEDFAQLSCAELITKLNQLLNNHNVMEIASTVEDIKSAFYKRFKNDRSVAQEQFEAENTNGEIFKFADDHFEATFKELYNQFRKSKEEAIKKINAEKEANYKLKLEIIEDIKKLINTEESLNKTFQDFNELKRRWKEIGAVPQEYDKSLWTAYNLVEEEFYDYIKINKELRDLDLKKNLEAKTELCQKAEALILDESVVKAFRMLQDLHSQWREIGPVPNDSKDALWERFKTATSVINKKHQEFFDKQKNLQVENLAQKTALCEQIETILNSELLKPKDWEDKSADIIKIQELWRTIGYAPKKDNAKIYQRFKNGCDQFFAKKREFYKTIKADQKSNLQLKIEICEKAEALKDSTDWKNATDGLISLQKQWKEIGQIPKKQSEALWKRFRAACDHFFNAKNAHFNTGDEEQESNLAKKKELIDKAKNFEKTDDNKENLRLLMDIQKEWANIGHVPLNQKDTIQKEFKEAINAQFAALKIEANEREKASFKNKIDNWANSPQSKGKIYSERNKIVVRIKELENEITLYENNMGFFSKSANSEALIKDISRKIERVKANLAELYEKLQMLNEL